MKATSIREYILRHDHHFVVACKPAGMPVQEDRSQNTSLLRILEHYCKQKLHLCNRLDRPVSGLVLLSKSNDCSKAIMRQMENGEYRKKYLALVPKSNLPNNGVLTHRLAKRGNKVYQNEHGKLASLTYRRLGALDQYDILEIESTAGHFHQIRSQLAVAGIPLRGDVKYGARRANKDRSIGLFAHHISFIHPRKGQRLSFDCPLPKHDIWPEVEKHIKMGN